MPRISVVVPTYNNAAYVDETVQSILRQSYRDFELVIADHASSDGTWNRLQRYADDPRVRLLQTEAGGGAERNWNRVSRAATGEWVKLVCGDDLLRPDCLAEQVQALDDSPGAHDVTLVSSPRAVIDAQGRQVVRGLGLAGLRNQMNGSEAIRRAVRRGTNIFGEPCATMLRRDVLERSGWWDGRRGYFIDEATYFKVLRCGDVLAVPKTLSAFRLSATQWSVRLANQQVRQAAAVHREALEAMPEELTEVDLYLGNARAWSRALQRRILYRVMRHRLRLH